MDDRFNFGERARRPAKPGVARPGHAAGSFDGRIVWIAAGLVVAAVVAFAFLRGADEAGERIADARSGTVGQIDQAYDAAAKASIGRAVVVARTLYAERGAFSTDTATLSRWRHGFESRWDYE